jgi:hypothetical protein
MQMTNTMRALRREPHTSADREELMGGTPFKLSDGTGGGVWFRHNLANTRVSVSPGCYTQDLRMKHWFLCLMLFIIC